MYVYMFKLGLLTSKIYAYIPTYIYTHIYIIAINVGSKCIDSVNVSSVLVPYNK